MYNNFQQPPAYQSQPNNTYAQPTYSNQYEQPSYIDNTYMNQQSPPMYQTMTQQQQPQIYQPMPQQPPPNYATAVQSPPYSAPVVQQPTNTNTSLSANNPKAPGTPFSKGYKWPRKPMTVVCPQCGATVTTRVETEITAITVIGVILLCLFTCILGCLPLFIPAFKRSTHYCPYCNSVLGTRPPLR